MTFSACQFALTKGSSCRFDSSNFVYFPNPKAPYLLKLDREDVDMEIRCKFHFLGVVSPFAVLHDFRWIFYLFVLEEF